MGNQGLRRLWDRVVFAETIVGVWERLPQWVRAGFRYVLAPIMGLIVTGATGALIWATGFVQEYWALAVLSVLAGTGSGVLLRRPVDALARTVSEATDAVAQKRAKLLAEPDWSDREMVQDFRTLWNRHGEHASRLLHDTYQSTVIELVEGGVLFADELLPKVNGLRNAQGAMDKAVAADSGLSGSDVRDRFHEWWHSYLVSCRDLAQIEARGSELPGKKLARWREAHYHFRDRLLDLHEKPAHKGVLRVSISFDADEAFFRFIEKAQVKPSTSDIAELPRPESDEEGPGK